MPMVEENSMMMKLNFQCLDKVYYRRPRLGIRKKFSKIMGIKLKDANGYLMNKEGSVILE